MSFNLRYITHEDTGALAWTARRDQVAELITREHPDLVGLQEALRPMLNDLDQRLAGYIEIGVGREDGKEKGEYSALLVKASRFGVQESGNFWLSDTPEVAGSKSWGNEVVRICTWAKLYDRQTRRSFHFFNTHMDHHSQPSREKGMALILSRISEHAGNEPYILTGDFNARADNPVHSLIAKSALHPTDVWKTLNPDVPENESGTAHDFTGKTDTGRIDYIYTSADFKPLESSILHDAKDGNYPSDHFPLRATLGFPGKGLLDRLK